MTVSNNKSISGITSINAQSNSLELFDSAGVSLLDLNTNSVTFPGNVAIGTPISQPAGRRLRVVGDVSNSPKQGYSLVYIENTLTSDDTYTSIVLGAGDTGGTGRHGAAISMIKDGTWTGDSSSYPGHLSFWTRPTAGSEVERLRITSGGNIGIGVTDPDSKLESVSSSTDGVNAHLGGLYTDDGTVAVRRIEFSTKNNRNAIQSQQGSGGTNFSSDNALLLNPSGGNVGINTDTPAETLSVAGNVRVENSADASQYLTINHQGIDFQNTGAGSSTTSSAHLLDDYEEGTFDPFATVAGSFTGESIRTGRYTRIGNLVYCDLRVLWTGTTGTSALRFDLPFVQAGTTGPSSGHTGLVFYSGTSVDASAISAHVAKDSTTVAFYRTAGGSFNDVDVNDVNSSYDWLVSFSYFVA